MERAACFVAKVRAALRQAYVFATLDTVRQARTNLDGKGRPAKSRAAGIVRAGRNLAYRLKAGYVIVATDTGHAGSDPAFAAGRPEGVFDWGYRAVHKTAEKERLVVWTRYGGARTP